MRMFLAGFLTAAVLLILGAFLYVRLGYVDPRADTPVSALESAIAMPALDASVDRHASDAKNPVPADSANLTAGMKIYQSDCSSCHGDAAHPEAVFADNLNPRPPQFVTDAPDMPENQNFYIVEHGIRFSGMPSLQKILTPQQAWQVTTFLSHMDKLPPDVQAQWKTLASAPAPQQ
ncbi:MAG TPA: c-type cytochrome [Terracidiphilus sp.]|nr:c-type cytochrome [Terracidiphilus sp.]